MFDDLSIEFIHKSQEVAMMAANYFSAGIHRPKVYLSYIAGKHPYHIVMQNGCKQIFDISDKKAIENRIVDYYKQNKSLSVSNIHNFGKKLICLACYPNMNQIHKTSSLLSSILHVKRPFEYHYAIMTIFKKRYYLFVEECELSSNLFSKSIRSIDLVKFLNKSIDCGLPYYYLKDRLSNLEVECRKDNYSRTTMSFHSELGCCRLFIERVINQKQKAELYNLCSTCDELIRNQDMAKTHQEKDREQEPTSCC